MLLSGKALRAGSSLPGHVVPAKLPSGCCICELAWHSFDLPVRNPLDQLTGCEDTANCTTGKVTAIARELHHRTIPVSSLDKACPGSMISAGVPETMTRSPLSAAEAARLKRRSARKVSDKMRSMSPT